MSFASGSFDRLIQLRLRMYAVTLRNKFLAVYFGALALTRLSLGLASAFSNHPTVTSSPDTPVIDAFNLCVTIIELRFTLALSSVGTTFGT